MPVRRPEKRLEAFRIDGFDLWQEVEDSATVVVGCDDRDGVCRPGDRTESSCVVQDGEIAGKLLEQISGGDLVVYSGGLERVLAEQIKGHARVGLEAADVKWSFFLHCPTQCTPAA